MALSITGGYLGRRVAAMPLSEHHGVVCALVGYKSRWLRCAAFPRGCGLSAQAQCAVIAHLVEYIKAGGSQKPRPEAVEATVLRGRKLKLSNSDAPEQKPKYRRTLKISCSDTPDDKNAKKPQARSLRTGVSTVVELSKSSVAVLNKAGHGLYIEGRPENLEAVISELRIFAERGSQPGECDASDRGRVRWLASKEAFEIAWTDASGRSRRKYNSCRVAPGSSASDRAACLSKARALWNESDVSRRTRYPASGEEAAQPGAHL